MEMAEMVSCTCMDGECMDMSWGNQRLQSLSEQLRSYNPVGPPWPVAKQEADENDGRVVLHQSVNESTAEKSHISDGDRSRERRAAVLICLFEGDQGELRVILTQRSYNLATYPGEVALPGGKMEEGDVDDSATALRESMEEIGLDPSLVQVVALLEPFISKHLSRVIPVVGLLANRNEFKPLLNTDEVQAIFDVPLEMFLKEENHRMEEHEWMGWKYYLHLFDFESEQGKFLIWGLTAGILIRAASVIYQRPPLFEEPSPDFQELQRTLMNQTETTTPSTMISS